MTHDGSSRQLPTNQYHASLWPPVAAITREYQIDSPSQQARPMDSFLTRDGPGGVCGETTRLTGSYISVFDYFHLKSCANRREDVPVDVPWGWSSRCETPVQVHFMHS